jgi:hypothetical protein
LGFPDDAPKMSYLRALAIKHNVAVSRTLVDTLYEAVSLSAEGPENPP